MLIQGQDEKGGADGMACRDDKHIAQVVVAETQKNDFEHGWGAVFGRMSRRLAALFGVLLAIFQAVTTTNASSSQDRDWNVDVIDDHRNVRGIIRRQRA